MSGTANADNGLQRERTALSWRRTGLAAAIVPALAVHRAINDPDYLLAVVPASVMMLVVVGLLGRQRARRLRHSAMCLPAAAPATLAAAIAALAVVELIATVR